VEKSNGTLYWYCTSCGRVLAESDLSGNLISEYTYFGNLRIARRDVSSGNVYYIFSDRLGSYRTLTDSSGNVKGESDYYPFGAERVISSTVTDNFRFAGMEWDSEDGLNHTLYRKYTPAQGRWESPDPVFATPEEAQGLNRYSYVRDAPTYYDDPTGACGCGGGGVGFGEGGIGFPCSIGLFIITFDCGDNKSSCCAYYTWLQNNPNSDAADRAYGQFGYEFCNNVFGTGCWTNCTRQCLVIKDIEDCLNIRSPLARTNCRFFKIHPQCYADCAFWFLIPNPLVVPFPAPYPVVIPIDIPIDYSCSSSWWESWEGRPGPRPVWP
jgi:RHS repeat-associated protein